jgi:hypothetical protein
MKENTKEDGIKRFLERQGYENIRGRLILGLIILVLAFVIFLTYFIFFQAKTCQDSQCFRDSLKKCDKARWIREDSQASWLYTIKGGRDICEVDVELLLIKGGAIENEELQGQKMTCMIQKGSEENPEDDMTKCSGPLREGIQEIVIQRMHNYILENLGEIKQFI